MELCSASVTSPENHLTPTHLEALPHIFSFSKMTLYNPINTPCCYMPWHPCILCLEFLLISVFKILLRSPSFVDSALYQRGESSILVSKPSTYLDTFVSLMQDPIVSYYLSVFPTGTMDSLWVLFYVLYVFVFSELLIF